MSKTTARAGGEYVAELMTRCGCTKVLKMTGATPPKLIKMPMVTRRKLVTVAGEPDFTTEDVRTFTLNEEAEEVLYGMPAFQYLEELP